MKGRNKWKAGVALTLGSTLLVGTAFVGSSVAEEAQWDAQGADAYWDEQAFWEDQTADALWDSQEEELEAQSDSIWLTVGSSGDKVVYVQQLLNSLGFSTVADGIYGVYTAASVTAFQQAYGQYADGIVGPATLAALEALAGNIATPAPEPEPTPAPTPQEESSSLPSGGLSVGAQGAAVRQMQQALKSLGYSVYVDGDYGSQTANVVAAFQRDHGLYVDGYAGPETMAALSRLATSGGGNTSSAGSNESSNTSAAESQLNTNGYLKVGANGEQVKILQQKLRDLGYAISVVDGIYGQNTAGAVRTFQRVNGLYTDGEAGPQTLKALTSNPKANETSSSEDISNLTTAQKLARARLDAIGWDLYAAYKWAVGITYVKFAVGNNVEEGAVYAFQNNAGDCIGKAASFCVMARELGYDCNVIWGKVPYRAGGYGDHAWTEIFYNGATYVCDPQFEWNDGKNGYMINYGQSGTWMYQRDGYFPG